MRIRAVEHVLTELGFENIPRLRFFNKGDLVESEDMQRLCQRYKGIGGSALNVTSLHVIQQEIVRSLLTLQDPTFQFSGSSDIIINEKVHSENGVG